MSIIKITYCAVVTYILQCSRGRQCVVMMWEGRCKTAVLMSIIEINIVCIVQLSLTFYSVAETDDV